METVQRDFEHFKEYILDVTSCERSAVIDHCVQTVYVNFADLWAVFRAPIVMGLFDSEQALFWFMFCRQHAKNTGMEFCQDAALDYLIQEYDVAFSDFPYPPRTSGG